MQHIRFKKTKGRSVNRLNLRMRQRALSGLAKASAKRVNLYAIRTIEQGITNIPSFDHEYLEELSRDYETDVMDRPVENVIESYDATNVESWPVETLDYQNLDGAQNSDKAILGWCLDVLSVSDTADAMIEEAQNYGWNFGLADLETHDYHLDAVEKKLLIHNHGLNPSAIARSSYFMNAVMVSMMRGLRDIWQEKRHGGFEDYYGPEHVLMLERVRAADLDVVSIMIAWELRNHDHPEIWRYILASEASDMAMAYAGSLEQRPFAGVCGNAATAAFRRWFDNAERVNRCDHETLDYLDDLSKEANGEEYHGTRRPTEIGLEILSCMPDKTAYLKGWGNDIMTDPHFCGLNDPINQAYFMQIVNERAVVYKDGVGFRDTELAAKIFPTA